MSELQQEHLTAGLRLVATLSLEAMRTLPISQQLMAFDGLAAALKGQCPVEAQAAANAAEALRRAEACQYVFREILDQAA